MVEVAVWELQWSFWRLIVWLQCPLPGIEKENFEEKRKWKEKVQCEIGKRFDSTGDEYSSMTKTHTMCPNHTQ